MKVVIIGIGKVGSVLAEYISKEGQDVTVIDKNPKLIDEIVNRLDVMGVVGNGANYDVQKEAGVDKADLLIAATPLDELNILSCLVGKKIGTKHTIARVRNPDYSEQMSFMSSELGLGMVINPEYDAAKEIVRIIQYPAALKLERFAKGSVDMVEIKVQEGNPLAYKKLCDLKSELKIEILVCAVERENDIIIPSGDFVIMPGDKLHITSSHAQLASLLKSIELYKKRIKSVMIIGGGKISYYLAELLQKLGISIKLIELDKDKCESLAASLPKATIINADGTNGDVLIEEGIDNMDACISLTDMDEENIIISMFAKTRKVNKIITKITRTNLVSMLPSIGIDVSIISPKNITANNIVRYMRGIKNTNGSNIKTLYKLINDQVEAIEFEAAQSFKGKGIALKDLKLKSNLLIACIIRNDNVFYPNGLSTIEAKDRVVVVTTNQALQDLNDILM